MCEVLVKKNFYNSVSQTSGGLKGANTSSPFFKLGVKNYCDIDHHNSKSKALNTVIQFSDTCTYRFVTSFFLINALSYLK